VSFSTSYAVAWDYALRGITGPASKANPGYVYVLDTSISPLQVVDPVLEVAQGQKAAKKWSTDHDGGPDLILGIAASSFHPAILTTNPKRRGASLARAPSITTELNALVFALRDAEILVTGGIPPACIVDRDDVW